MKILLNTTKDKTVGSSRIWIYDLHSYLTKLGLEPDLNVWDKYNHYDVVIFEKGISINELSKVKKQNKYIQCGIINPSDEKRINIKNIISNIKISTENPFDLLKEADFYLVGSVEERDYLLQYSKNVLIFPLIESQFSKVKQHKNETTITLSYHGNLQHLHQFEPNLKNALERLKTVYPIRLIAVYNKKQFGEWKYGRPNIPVETYQWNIDTIEDILLTSDIGLVPCVNITTKTKQRIISVFSKLFFYKQENNGNDYLLRFKNKGNAGRAFVYHQLGIPVVAGFIPSMGHIIGTNQNGFMAHSESGWYYAIEELIKSRDLRQNMADKARVDFEKNYDSTKWTEALYQKLIILVESSGQLSR